MAQGSVTLPPGFELEEPKTTAPKLPAGFELEPVQKKTAPFEGKHAAPPENLTVKESVALSPEDRKAFDERIRKERMPVLKSGFGAPAAFAGTVKMPFQAVSALWRKGEPVTPEEKKYGLTDDVGSLGRFGQEIERQLFIPMGQAAGWWKQQLSDPAKRATLVDRILSVGPQVVGTTVGTMAGGKVLSGVPDAAGKAYDAAYNPYGVKTRGEAGIEAAVEKHGAFAADEAPVREAADIVRDLGNHGHGVPDVVKKFMVYMDGIDKATKTQGPEGVIEQPPKGMTFADLKKWREALDTKIDWDKVEGGQTAQMDRAVKNLRAVAAKEEIKSVYRSGGPKEASDYVKAKKDYSRAKGLEKAARTVGGGVGGAAGVLAGAEAVRSTGLPYGGWIGGSIGGPLGAYLGGKYAPLAVRAITEAGKVRETASVAEQAAAELKSEKSSSVQAAKNFGKKGGPEGGEPSGGVPKSEPPKTPSGGESEVDQILRRANVPEDVKAKVREVMEKNAEMHRRANAPKGDPDAPPSEIMQRAKSEYEKKYGKSEKAAEMKTAQDNALKKMDEVNREKMRKSSSGGQAPRHNDAIAQAKKELGPNANISKVLQRADEIERAGRGQ